ncbi:MAG: tyrosine-type recombinase/integrase [Steroidobacteraceae bacterium]
MSVRLRPRAPQPPPLTSAALRYLRKLPGIYPIPRPPSFDAGRESMLGLGTYPDVSLKAAREKADEGRRLVKAKIDPAALKRAERLSQADTFAAIAQEWLDKQNFESATLEKARWTLDSLINPYIGTTPIKALTPPAVLEVLRKLEARGKHDTAHRTRQRISQVVRYAIATGRCESDPTRDLRGALTPVEVTSRAAVTEPGKVGELLRAIDGYQGDASTCAALKLAPLMFVRPGELRGAEWSEFGLEAAEWRIPGERMKMGDTHIVPLSTQALEILRALRPLTGSAKYLFPSLRTRDRPISENTLNAALRRMGFTQDEMTAHGFRAMASTLLDEQGFPPDVIELQLAHQERNRVRAAYNRAQRLAERRQMMQAWADYLDGLKASGNVVPIRRSGAIT